jgi:hypothetical protein
VFEDPCTLSFGGGMANKPFRVGLQTLQLGLLTTAESITRESVNITSYKLAVRDGEGQGAEVEFRKPYVGGPLAQGLTRLARLCGAR